MNKLVMGRVCEVQKNMYKVLYEGKTINCGLRGNFYHKEEDFPIVGDYVMFVDVVAGESVIEGISPIKTVLKRTDISGRNREQLMVSNVDYLFIATSLNNNFNVNRIARYITMSISGGVEPVVILTKADLCDQTDKFVYEIRNIANDVKVHATSGLTGDGINELKEYFISGKTIAIMGSSGVGKSTLVNAIVGQNVMKTSAIREGDDKGRHTTTYRELIEIQENVWLIDTPGLREFGVCDDDEGLKDTFSDVIDLISKCRFRDCSHTNEPKCAIKEALANGTLSEERWKLYRQLNDENKRNFDAKKIARMRKEIAIEKNNMAQKYNYLDF